MSNQRYHRLSTHAGVLAAVVSIGAILAAVLAAPWFSWPANALSDLGVSDAPERYLFNYGLVLSGLLGLLFLPALRQTMHTPAHKLSVLPLGAALAGVTGVGLFPAGHPLHFPMALTAYVGFIASVITYGIGDYFIGEHRRAVATVGSGVAHFGFWVAWGFVLVEWLPGLAVPEFVGALLFNGWVLVTARRLYGTHSNV
ncbi:DUF998 domain-containing protein [Halorarius litoreus]|uniref:DUF998 domain-containing protein n=1 Tax=Halorarius litoreus TaxID=2962676 RepID=UPI0020CDA1A9|nr:DUF998 domain-containing protein [Halorarius litoreus]